MFGHTLFEELQKLIKTNYLKLKSANAMVVVYWSARFLHSVNPSFNSTGSTVFWAENKQ